MTSDVLGSVYFNMIFILFFTHTYIYIYTIQLKRKIVFHSNDYYIMYLLCRCNIPKLFASPPATHTSRHTGTYAQYGSIKRLKIIYRNDLLNIAFRFPEQLPSIRNANMDRIPNKNNLVAVSKALAKLSRREKTRKAKKSRKSVRIYCVYTYLPICICVFFQKK